VSDRIVNLLLSVQNQLTMGATSGAGTAYPSGASEFTPVFLVGFVLLDL